MAYARRRVLRGAAPGNLLVLQPTTFGLTPPGALLAQANEVIE